MRQLQRFPQNRSILSPHLEDQVLQDDERSDDLDSEHDELFQAVLVELSKPQKESGNLVALFTISAVTFAVMQLAVGGNNF